VASLPSPRKDVYDSPQWKAAVASIPQNQRVTQIAQLPAVGAYPFFRLPQLTKVWTPIIADTFAHKTPPAQALDWAYRCVSGNADPRAPLMHQNNGVFTLVLLMLVWGRAEDLIRSNAIVQQHFTYLLDHLVAVQVPGADELQQRLEQRG